MGVPKKGGVKNPKNLKNPKRINEEAESVVKKIVGVIINPDVLDVNAESFTMKILFSMVPDPKMKLREKKKRKPTFDRKKPAARKKAAPKRKPAKKKPAKKKKRFVASDDDDSEDSDFETKDRKRRHMAKEKVERETRGVQLKKFEVDSEEEFKNRVYSDDD